MKIQILSRAKPVCFWKKLKIKKSKLKINPCDLLKFQVAVTHLAIKPAQQVK